MSGGKGRLRRGGFWGGRLGGALGSGLGFALGFALGFKDGDALADVDDGLCAGEFNL
jgi:hypothetical protein